MIEYPKYKVTVSCKTYNQAKYITDTMNGFTMQQTSFPFVCTIVDDASTDGEQEVIRKYVEDNFDFSEGSVAYHKETDYAHITYAQHKTNKNCYFAVLYLKENHYSQGKDKAPYLKDWEDGVEYMAICEGDDYWIVPDKLEQQVQIMDNNPNIGLVYTKVRTMAESGNTYIFGKKATTFLELLRDNTIPTLTTCFRKVLYEKYFHEISPAKYNWKMGDYPLWLYLSIKGELHFINEISGIYRVLKESASHSNDISKNIAFKENYFEIKKFFIDKYLDGNVKLYKILEKQKNWSLFIEYIMKDDYVSAFSFAKTISYNFDFIRRIWIFLLRLSPLFRRFCKKRWLRLYK